jgi:hypothetical protein
MGSTPAEAASCPRCQGDGLIFVWATNNDDKFVTKKMIFTCLSLIPLIVGGIMYGVCKDASVNGSCGGNQEISDAGFIMMIVGGSMLGLSIFICFCFMGVVCCSGFCDNV